MPTYQGYYNRDTDKYIPVNVAKHFEWSPSYEPLDTRPRLDWKLWIEREQDTYLDLPEWDSSQPLPPVNEAAVASASILYTKLKRYFPVYVQAFEDAILVWRMKTLGMDVRNAVTLDMLTPVLDLGPKIIPLVVHELAKQTQLEEPDAILRAALIMVYIGLEENEWFKLNREKHRKQYMPPRHARLIVELSAIRTGKVDQELADFERLCDAEALRVEPGSDYDIDCDWYYSPDRALDQTKHARDGVLALLSDFGDAIIPNIMVHYAACADKGQRNGYVWPAYDLFNYFVPGMFPNLNVASRVYDHHYPTLFQLCKTWFETGVINPAPNHSTAQLRDIREGHAELQRTYEAEASKFAALTLSLSPEKENELCFYYFGYLKSDLDARNERFKMFRETRRNRGRG
ncbi:hypothetical protein QBC35DRAFT_448645 [Podospora australis]|uniref:Uncharacterized protein n=1 Tax=Podospora australis TaxID=1536484 RepID=A0AAN6WZ14_9PEZI|nr:hypothetical protein QBC35DRAFT_448645 [Podospora australis]